MKTILFAIFPFLLSTQLMAQGPVLISKRSVTLPVDISTAKLKLSRADYSSPVVKVLVPALADVTLLNHRNTDEGAPCLATYETLSPDAVIQNDPKTEEIKFEVSLFKHVWRDENAGLCRVTLEESVEGKIRGFTFVHNRLQNVEDRHLDDCR